MRLKKKLSEILTGQKNYFFHKIKMPILVTDRKLFAIILYSAFKNHEFLTFVRDIWKNPWVTGIAGASAIGLAGWLFAPVIVSAIILAIRLACWFIALVIVSAIISAIGLIGWIIALVIGWFVAPAIVSAIIQALGFGSEGVAANTFGSWFMSLYGGVIPRGSLVSVLQSIGAAGLGSLSTRSE